MERLLDFLVILRMKTNVLERTDRMHIPQSFFQGPEHAA